MTVTVQRLIQTKQSTTGEIALDAVTAFVSLEPPKTPNPPPNGNGAVCIDAGTYPLTIRWSPKFGKPVPHVENVPGRTAIEMHVGNIPLNSDGCTLVGKDYGQPPLPDYISQSAVSFQALMAALYAQATLTNPDAPEIEQVWDCGTIQYIDPVYG